MHLSAISAASLSCFTSVDAGHPAIEVSSTCRMGCWHSLYSLIGSLLETSAPLMRNNSSLLDAKACPDAFTQQQQPRHPTLIQESPKSPKDWEDLEAKPRGSCANSCHCWLLLFAVPWGVQRLCCVVQLISVFVHIAVVNSSSLPPFTERLGAAKR